MIRLHTPLLLLLPLSRRPGRGVEMSVSVSACGLDGVIDPDRVRPSQRRGPANQRREGNAHSPRECGRALFFFVFFSPRAVTDILYACGRILPAYVAKRGISPTTPPLRRWRRAMAGRPSHRHISQVIALADGAEWLQRKGLFYQDRIRMPCMRLARLLAAMGILPYSWFPVKLPDTTGKQVGNG